MDIETNGPCLFHSQDIPAKRHIFRSNLTGVDIQTNGHSIIGGEASILTVNEIWTITTPKA